MAQKRMIDKKISVSEQVARLSDKGQIVFTWSIPHGDDIGLIQSSHRTLKATIVPMWDMVLADFSKIVAEIVKEKLWIEYEHGGEKYYRIAKFNKHQTLKKDRQPQTILNIPFGKTPRDTWQTLEALGFHLEDNGIQMDTEEKRREEKKGEVKKGKKKQAASSAVGKLEILNCWNDTKVIVHKELSKDADKEIERLLADSADPDATIETIKSAISVYAMVLLGKEFWWSHKWNLYEFLKRGLKQFEGKTPEDYLKENGSKFEKKEHKVANV